MALFAQDVPAVVADLATDSGKRIAVSLVVTAVTAAVTYFVGRYVGRRRADRDWHAKEFLNQVTVSVNIFADGTLKFRTVLERSIDEMFLNRVAVEKVRAAAGRCTEADPILPIDPADRWYLLNFALNAVSEQFAAGYVRYDAGLPVSPVRYALFLTCEALGEMRMRKVRVMLVQEKHLRDFPYPAAPPPGLNPWHAQRLQTLKTAAARFAADPGHFVTLEVYP